MKNLSKKLRMVYSMGAYFLLCCLYFGTPNLSNILVASTAYFSVVVLYKVTNKAVDYVVFR